MGASVSLASPPRSLRPGATVTCDVKVTNTGGEPDRFSLRVTGDLAAWSWATPSSLSLAAGEEGTARIACQPPREPTTAAGPATLTVAVAPGRDPTPTVASVPVEIEAYGDVVADLEPPSAHGRRSSTHRLVVHNRGNLALRSTLSARGDDLELSVVPALLEVEPGAAGSAQVRARATRRRLAGGTESRSFQVHVEPADGPPAGIDGTFVHDSMVTGPVLGAVAGVLALVVLVVLYLTVFSSSGQPAATVGPASCPGAGHLAHDANGLVRANVIEPDNYAFLFENHGCAPVRFDPCQPVHYFVDSSAATPANLADLQQAIAMVGQATGMTFVPDAISADPAALSGIYAAAQAQGRWPPVGIDWKHLGPGTDQSETVGEGRPDLVDGVIVSGGISFNADAHLAKGAPVPGGFGPGVTWGRIMLHELGHVVGLGHVTSPDEIMHEPLTDQSALPTSAYGIGDLTGLRLLGRSAGCQAVPALGRLPQGRTPRSRAQAPASTPSAVPNRAASAS